jgi:hypothetical protein
MKLGRSLTNKSLQSLALPELEFSKLPAKDQQEYVSRAKDLSGDKFLIGEVDLLIQAAGENIIRRTKTDEEIAWNRGAIHGLESLKTRLRYLASLGKPNGR